MNLTLQLNKINHRTQYPSNFKTESSEDVTIRGEFKQFLKTRTSPHADTSTSNNLDSLVKKQREKLKIDPISKENKFNRKLHNFSNLKTFTDISKFLQDLNIVNNKLAYKESLELKQKLDSLCRVQQFAEFRTKNQLDLFKPSDSYTTKINSIKARMRTSPKDENLFQSQSLQLLRDVNKAGLEHYNENQVRQLQTTCHESENDSEFYCHVMRQLEHGSSPKKINDKDENQDVMEQLFTINQIQEKEKLKLTTQIQALEKNVGNKMVFLDQDVQVNSKKYYDTFKLKSKKIIHLLHIRQIKELQERQEEMDNMSMFTKKKTSPKKLVQLYKNKTFENSNNQLKNQKITKRHEEKELHRKNLIKVINSDMNLNQAHSVEFHKNLTTDQLQSPSNFVESTILKKFQNAVNKIIYSKTKTSAAKLRILIKQSGDEVKQNHNDNKYFVESINDLKMKNSLQWNKYLDPKIESIRQIEIHAVSQTYIAKKRYRPRLPP